MWVTGALPASNSNNNTPDNVTLTKITGLDTVTLIFRSDDTGVNKFAFIDRIILTYPGNATTANTAAQVLSNSITPYNLMSLSGLLTSILWFFNATLRGSVDSLPISNSTGARTDLYIMLQWDPSLSTSTTNTQTGSVTTLPFPLRVADIGRVPTQNSPNAPTTTTASTSCNSNAIIIPENIGPFNYLQVNRAATILVKTWTPGTGGGAPQIVWSAFRNAIMSLIFTSDWLYLVRQPYVIGTPAQVNSSFQTLTAALPSSQIASAGILGAVVWILNATVTSWTASSDDLSVMTPVTQQKGAYLYLALGIDQLQLQNGATGDSPPNNYFAKVADLRRIPGSSAPSSSPVTLPTNAPVRTPLFGSTTTACENVTTNGIFSTAGTLPQPSM